MTAHWGPNMRLRPTQDFVAFAHALIDCGADIFHGHSAHVVQGVEVYKGRLIMYDTGDFVDDYAVDQDLRNDLSFLFKVMATKGRIKEVQLVPVQIGDMQVNKATGAARRFITERTIKLSAELGTQLVEGADGLRVILSEQPQ